MIEIESKFYEEVHELECKYANKYAPLFDRVSPPQNCQDSSPNSWLILCSVDSILVQWTCIDTGLQKLCVNYPKGLNDVECKNSELNRTL